MLVLNLFETQTGIAHANSVGGEENFYQCPENFKAICRLLSKNLATRFSGNFDISGKIQFGHGFFFFCQKKVFVSILDIFFHIHATHRFPVSACS